MAHDGHLWGWTGTAWVPLKLDSSGRMVIDQPVGGGDGAGDIIWTDDVTVGDNPIFAPVLPDDVGATDDLGAMTARLGDEVSMDDAMVTGTVNVTKIVADDVSADDSGLGRVNNIYIPRSGTPDTDKYADAWLDAVLANQGVNHGNEAMSVASSNLVASTRDGILYFDLRGFVGMTAPTGGTMVLELWAGHAVAIGVTLSLVFSNKGPTTRPFTESTVTWSNAPAVGTGPITKQVNFPFIDVLQPPAQAFVTLTAAEYENYLGDYMMVRLSSDVLVATPLTVQSRESATASQRPKLSFDFKVP